MNAILFFLKMDWTDTDGASGIDMPKQHEEDETQCAHARTDAETEHAEDAVGAANHDDLPAKN